MGADQPDVIVSFVCGIIVCLSPLRGHVVWHLGILSLAAVLLFLSWMWSISLVQCCGYSLTNSSASQLAKKFAYFPRISSIDVFFFWPVFACIIMWILYYNYYYFTITIRYPGTAYAVYSWWQLLRLKTIDSQPDFDSSQCFICTVVLFIAFKNAVRRLLLAVPTSVDDTSVLNRWILLLVL